MSFFQTYYNALDKITKNCLNSSEVFVLYKKPNTDSLQLIIAKEYSTAFIEEIRDNSFVFMSFDAKQKGFIIPIQKKYSDNQILDFSNTLDDIDASIPIENKNQTQLTEQGFIDYVDKIKNTIQTGTFNKLVASRVFSTKNEIDLVSKFLNLCDKYHHAFNYLVYIPNQECWMGATPETLLRVDENRLHTISLAGTQLSNENSTYTWGEKEQEEQRIVTEYIDEKLRGLDLIDIQISKPYTLEAGNIAHLRTDIHATISDDNNIIDIINTLHPTPAVCGMPKEICKEFILENEAYDRTFYTGYLGIYKDEKNVDLYVNLRCASIDKTSIHYYVGCGITATSDAQKEWIETENKLKTLRY
jgi:isochorismate synthase